MGDLSQNLVVPDDAGFKSSRDAGFKQNRHNSAYAGFGVPKKYGHMIKMLHGPQKKYCDVIEILALSGCVVSTILQAQKLSRAGSQGGHRD